MKLVGFELRDYRRFEVAKCRLEGHLIAVVGPNEAGKTSLLRALAHLSNGSSIEVTDRTNPPSRNPDEERVIAAQFLLEDADLEALAGIPEAVGLRWLEVYKDSDGTVWSALDPRPERNVQRRAAVKASLLRTFGTRKATLADDDVDGDELLSAIQLALEAVGATDDMAHEDLEALDGVATMLSRAEGGSPDHELAQQVRALAQLERRPHPADAAKSLLMKRVPEFVWFGDEERSLASEYELTQLDLAAPPAALGHLAVVAGLDLQELNRVITDMPSRQGLLGDANARLARAFQVGWTQSPLTVQLYADGTRLLIHAHDAGVGYTSIAERSDGVRAFVALFCFLTARRSGRPTVLLIDEAESHLHYEAQADVVRAFTRQDLADVIYTTHSAGCLPEDLGTGVVVVEPLPGRRSVLSNSYWKRGPAFTGLVLAMGASALAFTPTRRALIGEGASDAVLLPSLLRDATGLSSLGFQVAPGLSEVSREGARRLDFEAARVAYVVDGDEGGAKHAAKLSEVGVPPSRILMLGGTSRSHVTLEDLLSADVLAEAINEALRRSGRSSAVRPPDLPARRRWLWLRNWCREEGVPEPDKMGVAQAIVEDRRRPRVSAEGRRILRALMENLRVPLEL